MDKIDIINKIRTIAYELLDLQNEIKEIRDDIKHYEGKDNLTKKQQEYYDWLDAIADYLDNAKSELELYM